MSTISRLPRETFSRLKMAVAAEKKTVRAMLLKLIEDKIQELEKKGLLPKGMG
jgi:predicted DNA-binding protein